MGGQRDEGVKVDRVELSTKTEGVKQGQNRLASLNPVETTDSLEECAVSPCALFHSLLRKKISSFPFKTGSQLFSSEMEILPKRN